MKFTTLVLTALLTAFGAAGGLAAQEPVDGTAAPAPSAAAPANTSTPDTVPPAAPPPATLAPAATAPSAPPVAASSAPQAVPVPDNYIIGPGDMVQVFVWRNPELSVSVPVRPDGKISTPLVEDMVAVGKTPTILARDLEKVISEYVRNPKVNVIVSQPLSTFSQVKVIGQVLKPQALPYRQGLTVLDAVLAVGGLTQFAAGNRAKIIRSAKGSPQQIRVKLANLVNGGDMRQNLELQPGDVLVIPESVF